jgi:ferredoxin, 2Fe-2S
LPTVKYNEFNGTEHAIEVETGLTVMEGAISHSIPGIDAECGGACACATCHVYVDDAWTDKLPPREEMEEDMLERAASEIRPNSRLSCQIEVSDAMDGLVVRLPEFQT